MNSDLTGPLPLSGIFLCRRFFLNRIFYRSFVRFRLSKLTHSTWHPWIDPEGSQINLKVRIQQVWSPLRTKKYDKQVNISYNCNVTQISWRSPLQSIVSDTSGLLDFFLKPINLSWRHFIKNWLNFNTNLTQMHPGQSRILSNFFCFCLTSWAETDRSKTPPITYCDQFV